jgi:hypothetical protein
MTNVTIPRDVAVTVSTLCEDLATPVSLSVAILARYGEWDQIALKKVDPIHYLTADMYWRDAVACSVLRKTEDLPTSFDREAKAVKLFHDCERLCFLSNERLSPFVFNAHAPEDDGIATFVAAVQKWIGCILGRPPTNVRGRFGPGSTYGDRGKLCTVPDKMSSRPTLTASAMGFLFPWTETKWATACAVSGRAPKFVPGNRFTTVPKDASKFRGIAIEPSVNLFYQLGLGRAVRRKLLQSGIDLKNGQDIHRQVAREASIRGHMSTLDLSNASDTICRNLVKLLLPSNWFELFDSLRSPTTHVDGKTLRLEKFSSMGNGFTFELETLVFLGICAASLESCGLPVLIGTNVLVYGDDIIVPTECSRVVISALRFFGMDLNESKSFVSGPFRESCGGDFFEGIDVRPYFLKEFPSEPQHYIAMANGFRQLASPSRSHANRSRLTRRAWFCILDALPSDIRRCRGPKDLGDLVIHDEEDRWQFRWRHSIRYLRCYRPARFTRIGWEHFRPEVVLATALYGIGDERGGKHPVKGIDPRDNVIGYKLGWVPRS